jgi:hypothetical protein
MMMIRCIKMFATIRWIISRIKIGLSVENRLLLLNLLGKLLKVLLTS